jgi:membrane protease subunit HflC
MKHRTTFFLGLLLAAVFLFYLLTFQVDFNEAAVVVTLGRVGDRSVVRGDSAEAGFFGNLYPKWPAPIDRVQKYDLRVQLVEDSLEQVQLADNRVATVNTYVAWRIENPLDFYRSLRTPEAAQTQLRERLRAARAAISQYTFDDLTNPDPAKLKLDDAAAKIQEALAADLKKQGQSYGVKIESVGIKRIVLPDQVAQKVFEQMKETRRALAQGARSEGDAAANAIVGQAKATSDTIMAFANNRAQVIRAEGDAGAAEYYKQFQQNEDFAIFLRKLDTYREVLRNNSTFLIDAKEGLFGELYHGPVAPNTAPAAPAAPAK